jgi:hypothetical protein
VVVAIPWGCSTAPITAWQRSIDRYVAEQGNGDPNVLRDAGASPDEPDVPRQFGLIGARKGGIPFLMPQRTDATALLLGHCEAGGRMWFIFLVGSVRYRGTVTDHPLDDPQVLDIRLAACSAAPPRLDFDWRVEKRNPQAVRRYAGAQLAVWRRSDRMRAGDEECPSTFPTPLDAFRLEVAGGSVTVTEGRSGATWTLALDAPPGAAAE